MNLNQLHDEWIEAGSKVQDLLEKKIALNEKYKADSDSVSLDEIKNIAESYKKAVAARDLAKQNYEDAREALNAAENKPTSIPVNTKSTAESIKNRFVKDFTTMITTGRVKNVVGSSSEDGPGNAGLTIPDDVQTAIRTLTRSFTALESLVNVETVSTKSGSRVYEKLADITPMKDLDDESAQIPDNDDPQLTTIKYLIHRYAGITRVTNTLLKDTTENILAWLTNWVAKKDVITRNQKILEVMGKASKKPTIANFDDIKDLQNNTLDPMINATSSFITNQSGFNVLSKLKDNEGRYMIQPNVTNPEIQMIDGHTVTIIADKYLPDVSGSHPIYFGDLKQGITLFDRQRMELMTTNVGGDAFRTDTTLLRIIDRFDVEVIDDGAWAVGSFKGITGGDGKEVNSKGGVDNKPANTEAGK